MKKSLLVAVTAVCLAGLSVQAQTARPAVGATRDGLYMGLASGYGFGNAALDKQVILGTVLGYKYNSYLRSDFTVDYRFSGGLDYATAMDDVQSDVRSVPVLINIYPTLPITPVMSAYAMIGFGGAYNRTSGSDIAKGDGRVNLAWNTGAGLEFAVNRCWSIDFGYRFSDLGSASVKNRVPGAIEKTRKQVVAHDLRATIMYHF